MSNLIQVTTVHVVQRSQYDFVDILQAVARENELSYIELFNKIKSIVVDRENKTATLSAEWNSGFSGTVTVNYSYR